MKQRKWILRDEAIRETCASVINTLPLDEKHPIEVIARTEKQKRTNEQNAANWRFVTWLAGHIGETPEKTHYDLLGAYWGTEERTNAFTGRTQIMPKKTSSTMSVKEFSDYLDWLPTFAADWGFSE